MKEMFALMPVLGMLAFGSGAAAQTQTPSASDVCTLEIEGMACSACAARVEKEALKIGGVTAARVSHPNGRAEVTFDAAKTSADQIAGVITKKTGFKAVVSGPAK